MLEMLGIPFTGSEAATMAIALDKAVAKAVVREFGVPTPRSLIMRTGNEPIGDMTFPAMVKPNAEGSSKGVGARSVAANEAQLRETVREQVAKYKQDILVEEFLPGREFTIAVLGEKDSPRCLPPMEIVFVDPDTQFPVYSFAHKLDFSPKIRYDRPAQVDAKLAKEIETVALGAWHALGCRDVARFDLRCDRNGRVCFIEVNTLPGMTPGWSDLCLIAEASGITYEQLIAEIMKPALARRQAGKI
jgi:D-alanine--D-alanine ligase